MVSNLTFTLLKFQGSPFLSQCFPMFLPSQDGQYSEGIQLQSQFPIVSCFGCFSLQTAQSCFKRDVSYILAAFQVLCSRNAFLQNLVNHMTRNGNLSFSLLHIYIRNLPPLLCRNFSLFSRSPMTSTC